MTISTEKVQISLHAQKLRNVAGAFKGTSDPYAVVTLIASEPGQQPKVLGKTEVIKNNLSPHWVTTFEVDYEFSKPTRINVGIYDEIRKAKQNKPMGSAVFEIGEVLGSRGNIKAKKMKGGGTLFCRIQKAPEIDAGQLYLELRGVKLRNVEGLFGKSDPFFEVSKLIKAAGGPTWQIVYRSEVVMNDLNPKWKPISISVNDICDGDRDKTVLIAIKDWEKSGKHGTMGFFETSVNALLHSKVHGGTGDVKTIDTSKAFHLKFKGKDCGSIVVTEAKIEGGSVTPISTASVATAASDFPAKTPVGSASQSLPPFSQALSRPPPSVASPVPAPALTTVATGTSITPTASPSARPKFVDYLSGGLELQLTVAIDFTGSNGDPRKPGTLHYIDRHSGQLNSYEKALTAVGSIIAKYDSDQKFPILGFGAKFGGMINHCFQLGPTPEVSGVKGMLDAYRNTFRSGLVMSGPTVFAEVIQLAAAQARSKHEAASRIGQQSYHILLILTDGAVTDVYQTKETIRAAGDAPLSIVIVGIGQADFSAMQFLDDFQGQEGGGRDICQFVEFQRHEFNKLHLTQATLEEIPDQVVDYFQSNGIKPLPAVHGSQLSIIAEEYNEDEEIDLSLEFKEDGEINLASGGFVDETGYGDYDKFAGITPMPPPPATAPPQSIQGNPPAYYNQQFVNPYMSQGNQYQPQYQQFGGTAPGGYQQQPYSQQQPQVVGATVVASPVFHVQLPPGANPGQQLQINHPQTGQPMIITVPPGVVPGGTFPVPY